MPTLQTSQVHCGWWGKELEVYGLNISLYTIRKAPLLKQEKYIRLHTDEEIVAMTRDELISVLDKHLMMLLMTTNRVYTGALNYTACNKWCTNHR